MIGIFPPPGLELIHVATLHQAASGFAVGDDDGPLRIENLRCLGHEPNAAESDHVAFKVACFASQFQAVADGIG